MRHSPGAAGTVVCNLAALGIGTLHAVGFTGDDGEAYDLRKDLAALGCRVDHLACDPQRMTPIYLKPRDAGIASPRRRTRSLRHEEPHADQRSPRSSKIVAALDALLPELDAVIVARPGGGRGLRRR